MTSAELETRQSGGAGFADSVTLSFADPERGWFGLARLGVTAESGSALAILFRGREPVGALAQGALDVPAGDDWSLSMGALRMTVEAPLERWTVAWDGEDSGFELELAAVSAPVSRRGGMTGYEQLVDVRGTVRTGSETFEIEGVGQRGHAWGVADWDSLELVRTVSAWLGDGGIVLESMRPETAEGHDAESIWATLLQAGEPIEIDDPRLSTTYDGDGHQRRAGLELWLEDDHYPLRAAGQVICGSSLDLGSLTLDLAFFAWTAEGVAGIGRYDILRRR